MCWQVSDTQVDLLFQSKSTLHWVCRKILYHWQHKWNMMDTKLPFFLHFYLFFTVVVTVLESVNHKVVLTSWQSVTDSPCTSWIFCFHCKDTAKALGQALAISHPECQLPPYHSVLHATDREMRINLKVYIQIGLQGQTQAPHHAHAFWTGFCFENLLLSPHCHINWKNDAWTKDICWIKLGLCYFPANFKLHYIILKFTANPLPKSLFSIL